MDCSFVNEKWKKIDEEEKIDINYLFCYSVLSKNNENVIRIWNN